jgi:hypothetical protein
MEKKEQDKEVALRVVKIDLPKVDVTKYIGKKAKIESAKTFEGKFGMYVKVQTNVVETIGSGDKAVELRGSKILGLQQDVDGIYGYGDGTKLDLFLKKYKCKELKDLVGKEVILQSQTSKESDTEFLTFN